MSVHQLPDGRWIVKIPDPSKASGSRREYFGRGFIAEQKARARDRDLCLKRTRPRQDDNGPTFAELASAYMAFKQFHPDCIDRCVSNFRSAIFPAIGNVTATRISFSDMEKYVTERRQNVKANTVRRELALIQAILNWSASRRPPLIPMNPIKGFSPPKADDAVFLPPTAGEVAAIMKHGNERLRRFIKIAWYTGLRPGSSELLALTWESVVWDAGVIRVISAKKGGIALREVPIHPQFLPELRQWAEKDGCQGPIISYAGKRMHFMFWSWSQAKKKAGITRRLRMYDLRHFFVTSAVQSGADYKTLSDIVGSNPETLRKYYQHVSSAARVRLIENMPVLPDNF